MNFFKSIENIFLQENYNTKIAMFEEMFIDFTNNKYSFDNCMDICELNQPIYNSFLNIVPPKDIKSRKYFDTNEGKAILLHTIVHIEYSAIDLALDACMRFQNMPKDYYYDWLVVAQDEIRHFKMLLSLLESLGYKYGDFVVHTNLFEAMKKTKTLIERMAIVPRFLEANGLEQNPIIMKKLSSNPDEMNKKILEALEIILNEEIDHVKKGDKWFKFECDNQNLDYEKTYYDILEKFYPGSTSKKQDLNFEARKLAGFSCDELKFLSKKNNCKEEI